MPVTFHAGASSAARVLLCMLFTALLVSTSGLLPAMADEGAAKPAAADAKPADAKPAVSRVPDATEKPVVTAHSITVDGRSISYHAEAGMLPLLKEDGAAKASVFYVAYTLDPPREPDASGIAGDTFDAAQRPLLFCFNGGPGASGV
jgi:carboxypeptidase C (cathepsin A)